MLFDFPATIRLSAALALFWFSSAAPAAAAGNDSASITEAQHHGAQEPDQVVTITARVVRGDGSPASGAVVLSSARGQGVADEDGVVHLTETLRPHADAAHLTAAMNDSGATRTGSVSVAVTDGTEHIDAGVIMLAGSGECVPGWLPTFGSIPGLDATVHSLAVFDDGSGPALYAGGVFTATADGTPANHIAKWDGTSWSPLGSGVNHSPRAMTVFDDGSGPALYVGGGFTMAGDERVNSIAKWDGVAWSPVGSGMNQGVSALTIFDDGSGSGPALYASGDFTMAGGVRVNYIAKWDGVAWSPVGGGMDQGIGALTVFDDGLGGGPALYAGGLFSTAGGVSASRIAKWDGTSWSPLGSGMNDKVFALAVFDDGLGGGPGLYAGGLFETAGGMWAGRIAKWDGTSWSSLNTGVQGPVYELTVFDDESGGGPALYVGGGFNTASGVDADRIAKWDGTSWSSLESGLGSSVHALAVFDDGAGNGPALYAGGSFTFADGSSVSVNRIAKWDGAIWSALTTAPSNWVYSLAVFDDGTGNGPALYVGGSFKVINEIVVNGIAKWDGAAWSSLGSGVDGSPSFTKLVRTLAVFDDGSGSGPALYAGGDFQAAGGEQALSIAKWDGASWAPLGSGLGSTVHALTVFDDGSGDGPALYAGGRFDYPVYPGGDTFSRIAKWDGTSWSSVGTGLGSTVYALTVFDDGAGDGPALYAGGGFIYAGDETVNRVARWDGTSWSALGSGVGSGLNDVLALEVFDDGSGTGPALYAGGTLNTAGGLPASRIAKWDGTSWSPLGKGVSGSQPRVTTLKVFDDGSGGGDALYVGGRFTNAGGTVVNSIARWDGDSWSTLGNGVSGEVFALTVFDDGSERGPALYAGGQIHVHPVGEGATWGDRYLARWQGCTSSIFGDLDGDGIVDLDDMLILLDSWGPCPPAPDDCPTDLNSDGIVNIADLLLLLEAWKG